MQPRKVFIFLVLYCTLIAFCAPVTFDKQITGQAIDTITLRSGPGMNYKVVAQVNRGTDLILMDFKNDWYRVRTPDGKTGWAFKSFIKSAEIEEVVIVNDNAPLRVGPQENYKAFAILVKGKTFKLTAEQGNWYKILLPDGNTGWVSKSDAQKVSKRNVTPTTDTVIREQPDETSREIMKVSKGTELIQLDKKGPWYYVQVTEDVKGWMHENALKEVPERNIVVPQEANIRRGPGENYEIMETAPANTRLTELEKKEDWYKVRTPSGNIGWVYFGVVKEVAPSTQQYTVTPEYIVTNQDCNIRQGYGTNFEILQRVKKGTILLKIGAKDDWYRIKFPPNGQIGWIRNDLIDYNIEMFFTNQECNIRQGYSTTFKVIRRVTAGTPLAKIGSRDNWYRAYLSDGVIGWIRNDLVARAVDILITNQDCNVRQGPGTNWQKIGELQQGTTIIISRKEGDWYRVLQPDGKFGWLRQDLVVNIFECFETNDRTNIREGPGTNYNLVTDVPAQTALYRINSQADWFEVRLSVGGKGWVRQDLITPLYAGGMVQKAATDFYVTPSSSSLMTVTKTNIRIGPGLNYAILTEVAAGTELIMISRQGDWYEVRLPDGNIGYVHNSVFSLKSNQIQPSEEKKLYTLKISQIRREPDSNSKTVATLPEGTAVTKIDQRENWINIKLNDGTQGWIPSSEILSSSQIIRQVSPEDITVEYGTLKTRERVNIRSGPGVNYNIVDKIPLNRELIKRGSYNNWYQVQLSSGKVAWVSGDYVQDITVNAVITTTSTEVRELRTPDSPQVERVDVGTLLSPKERYEDWYAVTSPSGKGGWINVNAVTQLKYPEVYATDKANIRRAPSLTASMIMIVKEGTALDPLIEKDDWYFVKLADGSRGWISKSAVTKLRFPKIRIIKTANAYKAPSIKSEAIAMLAKDDEFNTIAKQGEWYKIVLRGGDFGWVYSSFYEEATEGNILIKQKTDIREGPGLEYKIIAKTNPGDQFKCFSEKDSWCQIITADRNVGWIDKNSTKDISYTPLIIKQQTYALSGPGENFTRLATLNANYKFTPTDERNEWYELKLSGAQKGWVRKADCVKQAKSRIVFTLDVGDIRRGPSTNSAIVKRVDPATDLMVIGESGDWYNVKLMDTNLEGWIKKDIVFE